MDRLAARVAAAAGGCDDHLAYPFDGMKSASTDLPLPAAQGSCTGIDDEGLEFSMFSTVEAKQEFIDIKQRMICTAAREKRIPYPGFDYVDGGTWVIQPDTAGGTRALAAKLGVDAKRADCR